MRSSTLITSLALMSTTGCCSYVLEDDYMENGDFFDLFTFYTSSDPTHGFVEYQSQSAASSAGLLSSSTSNVQMKVDSTNQASNGRPSVRITSNKSYNTGLFILDLEHMPGGICGTWPAFWLVGPGWPDDGEIDILEGVNQQTTNDMTLHTSDGCTITNNNDFSGTITTDNCYVDAAGQSANAGCGISTTDTSTYGAGFNSNKGGVYATEWTDSSITIHFFPRNSIPADITSGSPNPSSWSTPLASFHGGCDIGSHFKDMQIVFDTTFCGDWAGAVWSSGSCASLASTCESFVASNASAFADAYWSINSLKVYSSSTNGWSDPSSASAAASSVVSASVTVPTSQAESAVQTSSASASQTTFAISTKSSAIASSSVSSSSFAAAAASSSESWQPWVGSTGVVDESSESDTTSSSTASTSSPESTHWSAYVESNGAVDESPDGVAARSLPEAVEPLTSGSVKNGGPHEAAAAAWKRHLRYHNKRHGGAGLI